MPICQSHRASESLYQMYIMAHTRQKDSFARELDESTPRSLSLRLSRLVIELCTGVDEQFNVKFNVTSNFDATRDSGYYSGLLPTTFS